MLCYGYWFRKNDHDMNGIEKADTTRQGLKQDMNNETQLTRTILHDYLEECYKGYKTFGPENDYTAIIDSNETKENRNEWKQQMADRFGSKLAELIPVMTKSSNASHLPWVVNSLRSNNVAKMTLLCSRYQNQMNELIDSIMMDPVPVSMIECLLEELESDAISVLMYAH